MNAEDPVDDRERRQLERALHELGYRSADFNVSISALPPNPRERSLPRGSLPRRKEVVVTRSTGETFRVEAYLDGPWAGEVMQAVISGLLGPQA